jgi:hypothetical protein
MAIGNGRWEMCGGSTVGKRQESCGIYVIINRKRKTTSLQDREWMSI